jgi:sulfite reductase alpha subunit-like flavoprotein
MTKSATEIKARCSSILQDKEVVATVQASSTPSAVFDMVLDKTGVKEKAKAGRWLAVLRRDYHQEYKELMKQHNYQS